MIQTATIARARALRRILSPPEARLWVALRRLRGDGFHFRRQAPFQQYYLDFVCHAHRLAIEVDGSQHGQPEQARHDAQRDTTLARAGYRTLRIAAADVLGNLEGIVTAIRLALNQAPPGASRHPPLTGEGEGIT
ncbi:DUF559 domain-containing protein [Acidiphilium sp. AL]|uniref:endonuclease domain-containing protein n=1 Tax=Acidiphilium sp. AL TaxID=2871704 RepID=UPI0021CB0CD3|nr:DUF559 domain-containing protein [Acidiphilium sp. AL]MCU4161654.1 DUF559 domain-containing protein [Acidiphilium sp. AL]